MRYSKEVANKVIELYATAKYTIADICNMVEIHRDTFYDWKNKNQVFAEALKKVEYKRLDSIKEAARAGLMTLLIGKEFEEVTTEYIKSKELDENGNPKMIESIQRKVKKFILPNATSVIFALKNTDPEHFRDVFANEVSGKDGGPIDLNVGNIIFK